MSQTFNIPQVDVDALTAKLDDPNAVLTPLEQAYLGMANMKAGLPLLGPCGVHKLSAGQFWLGVCELNAAVGYVQDANACGPPVFTPPQPAADDSFRTATVKERHPSGSEPTAQGSQPSPRRLAANRVNAQKSTGPRTPEGKARSAMNALKHGLLARSAVVLDSPDEDPLELQHDLDCFLASRQTDDPVEALLLERIVVCKWRLARALRYESNALADQPNTVSRLAELLASNSPHANPPAAPKILPEKDDLDRLVRYESLIDREFSRSVRELRQLRADYAKAQRNEPTAPPRRPPAAPNSSPITHDSSLPPPERQRTAALKSEISNLKSDSTPAQNEPKAPSPAAAPDSSPSTQHSSSENPEPYDPALAAWRAGVLAAHEKRCRASGSEPTAQSSQLAQHTEPNPFRNASNWSPDPALIKAANTPAPPVPLKSEISNLKSDPSPVFQNPDREGGAGDASPAVEPSHERVSSNPDRQQGAALKSEISNLKSDSAPAQNEPEPGQPIYPADAPPQAHASTLLGRGCGLTQDG